MTLPFTCDEPPASFDDADVTPATPTGAKGRQCRRHEWLKYPHVLTAEALSIICSRCGAIRDDARARRGKSARRLGQEGERRSERRYGWEKIGERGQITDLRGRLMKVQQKTTRSEAPVTWRVIFRELDATKDDRIAAILLSYVHQGRPADDYIIIRGADWLELHGRDDPDAS